ncbi:MAG: peptide chain release factor N(5)-glutamine methyltransferase [Anaerolineae bacterium]
MTSSERALEPAAAPHRAAAFLLVDGATVAETIDQAASALHRAELDTPRLDAEVLLAHSLCVSRPILLARLYNPLPANARTTFADLINRRLHHEPVAYLTGHKEFYGLDSYVDYRVLIPRPETELLVERAMAVRNLQDPMQQSQPYIADVGAGSGCITVALATHLPQARLYATDVSPQALEVTQINIKRHGVGDRVHLTRSDLLDDLEPNLRFDIIVANLPYVAEPELAQLPPGVRDYEPVERALAAGPEGLDLIRRLLTQAPARLRRGGAILLEIGATQGAAVSALARRTFPTAEIRVLQDLAGLDRVVEILT